MLLSVTMDRCICSTEARAISTVRSGKINSPRATSMSCVFGSLAERSNRCTRVSADGQPDLPPDCAVLGRGEHIGRVGPECPQTCRPDFSDCVDKTLIVTKAADPISCFRQVVVDQTFEVVELAVGDEDGSVSSIVLMTHI